MMGFLLLYNIYTHNSVLNGKMSVLVFKNGGQMLWQMELTEIRCMNALDGLMGFTHPY